MTARRKGTPTELFRCSAIANSAVFVLNYIGPGRSRRAPFLHARFESTGHPRETPKLAYSRGMHRPLITEQRCQPSPRTPEPAQDILDLGKLPLN